MFKYIYIYIYIYMCIYIYIYIVDGNNSAPLCMSCILRMHAYIRYARTRPRAQKPATLQQNQAQTTDGEREAPPQPRRRRGLCGPGLILLERRWFSPACARACVLYVCMRAEHAWHACICMHMYACIYMHAYTCMHTYAESATKTLKNQSLGF